MLYSLGHAVVEVRPLHETHIFIEARTSISVAKTPLLVLAPPSGRPVAVSPWTPC